MLSTQLIRQGNNLPAKLANPKRGIILNFVATENQLNITIGSHSQHFIWFAWSLTCLTNFHHHRAGSLLIGQQVSCSLPRRVSMFATNTCCSRGPREGRAERDLRGDERRRQAGRESGKERRCGKRRKKRRELERDVTGGEGKETG